MAQLGPRGFAKTVHQVIENSRVPLGDAQPNPFLSLSGLDKSNSAARSSMADSLSKFTAHLDIAFAESAEKPPFPSRLLLPNLFALAKALSDADEGLQRPPTTARAIYSSVALAVKHGVTDTMDVTEVLAFARVGLVDQDRSVRVAAGKIFTAYVEVYQSEGVEVTQKCEPLVDILSDLCGFASQGARETAITVIGVMGR